MLMTKRRRLLCTREENLSDWDYLLSQFTQEADRTQAELDNVLYQEEFFGESTQLQKQKDELLLFQKWLQHQIQSYSQMCADIQN